ncbi:alpha-mannosyltransferase [Phreatobacter aquaticus]|nr:hypothetical protein [Phreatobacter aquaticus]
MGVPTDGIGQASPESPMTGTGQGILVCAGGARMFTNAYVLIRVLRDTLGCSLPIEVWHMGAAEMSPAMAALLAAHGVTVIDASAMIATEGGLIRDGWQLKAFALARTGLAEVLMLDADQVPVRDPAPLFDWPAYRETGAVFWPDIVDLRADNPVWALVGLPPRQMPSLESGQLLVDRRRHAGTLERVLRLNEQADQFYGIIYGDKDTFLIGWLLEEAPFARVPHAPFVDPRVLFQCDLEGRPLFQHRTSAKWSLGDAQVAVANFQHEADCLRYLQELEQLWSGRIFHGPPRGPAARAREAELAGGLFDLHLAADRTLPLQLLAHGEIGVGRDAVLRNWAVIDAMDSGTSSPGAARFSLVIEGGFGPTLLLNEGEPGHWIGRKLGPPECAAELRAAGASLPAIEGPGLIPAFLAAAGFPACDDVALEALLIVLDGVEPGVAPRLRRLALSLPEGSRLALLADRLDARLPGRRDVDKRIDLLTMGYVAHGDGAA